MHYVQDNTYRKHLLFATNSKVWRICLIIPLKEDNHHREESTTGRQLITRRRQLKLDIITLESITPTKITEVASLRYVLRTE